jgi:MFS family permease
MGVWQGAVVWFAISIGLCVPSVTIPYLFQTPTASGFGLGKSIFIVSVALTIPAVAIMLLSATTTPLMRRFGAKGTMLLGALFGLAGFGMAFAHGSVWINMMWLAATGMMSAWAGSASYAVAAEAVPPKQGVIVSTICNTAGGGGAAIAEAVAGYVLTLRAVIVKVATPGGLVTEFFPAEETFTLSAMIVGAAALVSIVCVLTIRSKELRVAGRGSDVAPVALESDA